jgi:hypothetical protein
MRQVHKQRRNDLGAATAAAAVARRPVFCRNVENAVFKRLWDELDMFGLHRMRPHFLSSLVNPCVATV